MRLLLNLALSWNDSEFEKIFHMLENYEKFGLTTRCKKRMDQVLNIHNIEIIR